MTTSHNYGTEEATNMAFQAGGLRNLLQLSRMSLEEVLHSRAEPEHFMHHVHITLVYWIAYISGCTSND